MVFIRWQRSKGSFASRKPPDRTGFTLTELLITIAVVGLILGIVFALSLPAVRRARPPARQSVCKNNLKLIGLALHNYHDVYGSFPPMSTLDESGRPLHSWRTLLLPYLDQAALYETIDLTKPWDDPANAEAFQTALQVYQCPSAEVSPQYTTYLALVSPDSFFRADAVSVLTGSRNQGATTVMVIEVAPEHAVHWMEPQDTDPQTALSFGPDTEFAHPMGINVLFVDGSVKSVAGDLPAEERQEMMTYDTEAARAASTDSE